MKKTISLLLVTFICFLFLSGCIGRGGEEQSSNVLGEESYVEHSGYETTVKFLQYTWDGWGVSSKTVSTCDEAYAIIDALDKMSETGERVAKISNKTVSEGGGELPVERGTMWLEVGSKIYRIDRDSKKICRVDGHLGRGYVLDAPDSFFTLVYNAWQYYPYDYYTGYYNNSTG